VTGVARGAPVVLRLRAMGERWRDLLGCPTCRATLDDNNRCAGCGRAYETARGVLDLVPPAMDPLRDGTSPRWREALAGLDAWRARQRTVSAVVNVSPVDPRISRLLADAALAGAVVDVGGKDGAKRHAMPPAVTRYLSVDPCAEARDGETRAGLSWGAVRGVAEALPVRDGVADAVFSTAAMDYFVDTARGVAEFARVLRPGGTLALLVTAHPAPVARVRERPSRLGRGLGALRPDVLRAVGLRGALSLGVDGARAAAREHTRYLTVAEVEAALAPHFETRALARDVGRYSETLRVVAARR